MAICLHMGLHLSLYLSIHLLVSLPRCPAAISTLSSVVAEEYKV